ncbi:unnamed protein product [Dracunculus medinensis]|uniref:Uncharacterized protein n=1 Tax=Dracunculus medinensis TaxID=318479 RepID=A0A0N4UQ61_DRAME|nr:unnamed protein product [Dracunculus medinensis]
MELQSFEAYLDMMIDQINEESCNLIIEQPRYAHAVLVLANNDEPGELMAASRIKVFDANFFSQSSKDYKSDSVQFLSSHHKVETERGELRNSCSYGTGVDDEIKRALKKLEESRRSLDEPLDLKNEMNMTKKDLSFSFSLPFSSLKESNHRFIPHTWITQPLSRRINKVTVTTNDKNDEAIG